MVQNSDSTPKQGDRVAAAKDLRTTQGLEIVQGTEGTVAEDRGSKLVVFFADQTELGNLVEQDLTKLRSEDEDD